MNYRSGVAFLSVLFLTLVILMSVGVTVSRTLQGSKFQVQDQHAIGAFYAAESGLNEALAELHANKSWQPALYTGSVNDGLGRFEIRFDAAHSVNNLSGDSPMASFRGAASVPPYQALLVVTGFAGPRSKTLEALVSRGGLFPPGTALMSQLGIEFHGSVTVTSVQNLQENSPQPADVSVLNTANSALHASWDGVGQINIAGAVNSNSDNPGAIGSNIAAGNVSAVHLGQHQSAPRNLRIGDRVSQAFTQGFPSASLSGPATTLSPGNYTLSNPATYNGDLVLAGANLYVSGDFRLNGSIRGTGSVFVDGQTEMRGSTTLSGQDSVGVALYSSGDVTLTGLNGSQFLTAFMASAGSDGNGVSYTQHLANFRQFTRQMLLAVEAGLSSPSLLGNYSRFGNPPEIQGGGGLSDFDGWYGALVADVPWNDYGNTGVASIHTNPVRRLTQALEAGASSPTRDFLLQKFRELRPVPTSVDTLAAQVGDPLSTHGLLGNRPVSSGFGGVDLAQVSAHLDLLRNGSDNALFDVFNDVVNNTTLVPPADRVRLQNRVLSTLRELDFDRPGMAYFQGIVFTEGNFVARDEVRVVGALYAVGPSSRVRLENGVFVTFVPELAARAGQALGTVLLRQWVRR